MVKLVAGLDVPTTPHPTPGGLIMVTGTTPGAITSAAVIGAVADTALITVMP
jgi:hypothetical protein